MERLASTGESSGDKADYAKEWKETELKSLTKWKINYAWDRVGNFV